MMANGLIARRMDSVSTLIAEVHVMKGIGRMICNMERALKPGKRAANLKVNITWVLNREQVSIHIQTDQLMREAGKTIRSMGMVLRCGLTEGNTMDSGPQTSCMVSDTMCTRMESHTKDNLWTIKSKVLAFTNGQMDVNMWGGGTKENSMVMGHIQTPKKR